MDHAGHEQCSCLPVSACPGGGKLDMLLLAPDRTGSSVTSELAESVARSVALLLSPEFEDILNQSAQQLRRSMVSKSPWWVESRGRIMRLDQVSSGCLSLDGGIWKAKYDWESLRNQNRQYKERGGGSVWLGAVRCGMQWRRLHSAGDEKSTCFGCGANLGC